jgi:DNA topoisomerase-3
LFGINLTRLYTVLGRAGGYDGILSVGRVQTPLLDLVVRRDREIETFQPRRYFAVTAAIACGGSTFTSIWRAPENAAAPLFDNEGPLVRQEHALAIKAKVAGQPGTVVRSTRETKTEAAPLPYSLPDLQVDAAKRLGLTTKQTLDACQGLYETHRLVTYPRSDCRYLPEGHLDQATAVLAAVATNVPELASVVSAADRSRRSRAWNDEKVTAHHAIIPTVVAAPEAQLSAAERQVYDLVARRYVAQFLPPFEFYETRIEIEIAGERFRASGRQTIADGWCQLFAAAVPDERPDEDVEAADTPSSQSLPLLRDGDQVVCHEAAISDKQTKPPKKFTDATLIEAMTGISRFVDDRRSSSSFATPTGSAHRPRKPTSSRRWSSGGSSRGNAGISFRPTWVVRSSPRSPRSRPDPT